MSFLESFDEGAEELGLSIFLPSSPLVLFFLSGSKVGSLLVEPFLDLASLNGENKGGGRGGGRRRERERERVRERGTSKLLKLYAQLLRDYSPDWPSLKMAIHELRRSPASVFTSVTNHSVSIITLSLNTCIHKQIITSFSSKIIPQLPLTNKLTDNYISIFEPQQHACIAVN